MPKLREIIQEIFSKENLTETDIEEALNREYQISYVEIMKIKSRLYRQGINAQAQAQLQQQAFNNQAQNLQDLDLRDLHYWNMLRIDPFQR